jgi:hypothetical protein
MDITDSANPLRRLPAQFVPQQTIHSHARASLQSPRHLQRNTQHVLGRRKRVDDAVVARLGARPPVRLEQHLARHARRELEPWEGPDAGEVQTQVHGWHADEAAGRVHDAVVVRQREGARAAEGVAC